MMPQDTLQQEANSEEVHEIITAVPSWILRWGITLVFAVLGGIILLSAWINSPDVVKTELKVSSLNAPKTVLAKQAGKLTALLVTEGVMVKAGQPLAYLESTARPEDVLRLNRELRAMQQRILKEALDVGQLPGGLNLGEMQGSYQNFYQQYLQYRSTTKNGYYLNRMAFLEKDLADIKALNGQILKQQQIQQLEYANQEEEYKAYAKLYKNKVISRSEFAQQENKYLASKYPLQQSETAILNNSGTYSAKAKELLELRHTIAEEQAKFVQALNQCITESDHWMMQYVLLAPVAGRVSFAGIVQQNQNVQASQEVFVINPGNTDFFGEVQVPQYNMGKIKKGAKVMVKMRSYPYEQYGMISGKLSYISEVAYRDSVFIAKVSFGHLEQRDPERRIVLKNGMRADAEIITEESSLLQRFFRNITKMMNSH